MTSEERRESILQGFRGIAGGYDLVNDLMTFGLHRRWKREVIHWLNLSPDDRVLDLCCGTGDLAYLSCAEVTNGCVVGLDFAPEMMEIAGKREGWCVSDRRPFLVQADALHLPFSDGAFTAVTIGYGLRNLVDLQT
ncbi:MAG: class I SAM-dependent methyltransferase, partial [bacterium]